MAKGARADMLLRRAILALAFEIILPLFVLSLRFALVDPFLFGRQLLRRIPAPVTSPPRHSSSSLRPLPCILSPRPILPPSRAQGLCAWTAPRCAVVLGLGETYYIRTGHHFKGQEICKAWNDARGCTSPCPRGKIHVCDVLVDGRVCGKSGHARWGHKNTH